MSLPVCRRCHGLLQRRLRLRIQFLQTTRRNFHSNTLKLASLQPVQSWYWDTAAPTTDQLSAANLFFNSHPPRKLWTATEWRRKDKQTTSPQDVLTPEVAFLGRSNVGKSSLINALMKSPSLNRVGPTPGKTRTMHAWGLAATDPRTGGAIRGMGGEKDTKVTVLDMPGYGHASQSDWGDEIVKYLRQRKQLRRIFVLLDALHGVKPADKQLLQLLRDEGLSHQIIASKCDRFDNPQTQKIDLENAMETLRHAVQPPAKTRSILGIGEILAISSLGDGRLNSRVKESAMQGVKNVQWAILRAAGLDDYAVNRFLSKSKSSSSIPSAVPTTHSIQLDFPASQRRKSIPKENQAPTEIVLTKPQEPAITSSPSQSSTFVPDPVQDNPPEKKFRDIDISSLDRFIPSSASSRSSRPSSTRPRTQHVGHGIEDFIKMTGITTTTAARSIPKSDPNRRHGRGRRGSGQRRRSLN